MSMLTRAAVLASLLTVVVGAPLPAAAQGARPFEISDNSFLVEEAFNQEAGVFQNVLLIQKQRSSDLWLFEFTQEWPVRSQLHQLSYTIPFATNGIGIGNVMVNYRLQARMEDANGPAISPRLSVIFPTGDDEAYRYGVQANVPVSKQLGEFYVHANAGVTWDRSSLGGEDLELVSPHVAGSLIWRMLPMVHPMIEVLARFEESPTSLFCCGTKRSDRVLIAPGVRAGKNFGTHQLVAGAALPLDLSGGPPAADLVLYLSYELPFRN